MPCHTKLVGYGLAFIRESPPHRSTRLGLLFLLYTSVERLGALRAIPINSQCFQSELPSFNVALLDLLHTGFLWHVHCFRDCSRKERLNSTHHFQMTHVVDAAHTAQRFKGAIKDRQMLFLEMR